MSGFRAFWRARRAKAGLGCTPGAPWLDPRGGLARIVHGTVQRRLVTKDQLQPLLVTCILTSARDFLPRLRKAEHASDARPVRLQLVPRGCQFFSASTDRPNKACFSMD